MVAGRLADGGSDGGFMKLLGRYVGFVCLLFEVAALPFCAAAAETKQAQAQSYLVSTSHEQIVSMAKKEAKLRILTTMDDADINANAAAFKKKYPFLDVQAQQSRGTDSAQRLLLEIKSGM